MRLVEDDEFYQLPDPQDQEHWERVIAAGLHNPEPKAQTNGVGGYHWLDLTAPEYATPPEPPTVEGILYAGRRHVISGPPESTKTLVAYLLLLSALRSGNGVAVLDFEMGPHAAATLLRELGATNDELASIHYTEPDAPPTDHDIARLIHLGVQYVLIDAGAGAYDATGLDDNSRKDAEQFAAKWIRPLWQAGVATIVIDHVVKNSDARGKFAIGSERKTGQADVHIGLEAIKALHRGGTGMVRVTVHKDRPGHLPRPTLGIIELESDQQHNITWTLREAIPTEPNTGDFRHTIYIERISKTMESNPGHAWSKKQLEEAVEGKRDYIRAALNEMVADQNVVATADGKNLRYTLVRPVAPGSPQGRPGEGEATGEPETSGAGATPEPELELLVDKYWEELGE